MATPVNVLSFGEILWDRIGGKEYIGGAPFNCAGHLARMGVRSLLVSSVGRDRLGEEALRRAGDIGVDTGFVRVHPGLPTGTVDVTLDAKGSPSFIIRENTAWDDIILEDGALDALAREAPEAVCFGTLAQRSGTNRATLATILARLRPHHVLYDVNLRQNYYSREWIEYSLRHCTIAKCNDDEALLLSRMLFNRDMAQRDFAETLRESYGVGTVCITRGADGAAVCDGSGFFEVPGIKVQVADTVGAGDAFGAAFLAARIAGREAGAAAEFAVFIGSFVASRDGAVPDYTDEVSARVRDMHGGR